ncbi:MAG TPA: hypothetical protein VGN95_23445 [Pyrinomonadaceae bacterium]|jgi:hypothetical protein|nr:hypothetical protein [Pyrinomonadaceae bacterium]
MMKRIIVSACLLLTFVFGLPTLLQAQRRNAPRSERKKHTIANHPPVINSFTSSSSVATIPCPFGITASAPDCTPPGKLTLKLITRASDPDRDNLSYKYSVSGGQIVGKGSRVVWNFAGTSPGAYIARVVVEDQQGGMDSRSTRVELRECTVCPVPCPWINMSCPEDVEEGQALVFSVSLSGGDPNINPTCNWSVSAGKIVKGQGTYTIEVDTTGLAGKHIKATVEVGGLPPACQRTTSCEVQIRKKD